MAILYRIPPIGNEANRYAQKGPTCWYFAAKMLLKFHQKLEKREDNLVYEQFKQLHELRKVLTDLGEGFEVLAKTRMSQTYNNTRAWTREEVNADIEKARLVLVSCNVDEATIRSMLEELEARSEEKISRNPDPVRVERMRKAVEILNEKISDRLGRLELLSNFVPDAGFISLESNFSNGDDIEAILRKYGPVYAGGGLTLVTRVKMTEAFLTAAEEGKGVSVSDLEYIYEPKSDSAHALVISGIRGDSVFCVDPNASNKQVEIDLAAFKSNVDKIIAIQCEGCGHIKTQECTI